MGVPSIFLRTFGCNFTCDGFGMPKGQKSPERHQIAERVAEFKQYKDLPLVSTGCDSYASWMPEFKHLSPLLTTDSIAESICEMLPYKEWQDEHLVITGGEPLLGWQRVYPDLLEHPKMANLKELTFETNGTQPLTDDFAQYLHTWKSHHDKPFRREITFSVSAKLSCSGETREDAIKPEIVCQYEDYGYTYLKFVVATESDVEEALETLDIYKTNGFSGQTYLMPVGGVESVYSLNNRRVAEMALKYGLRYSDRLQMMWKNAWGT